jgi:hypothetical protein
LRLIAALATSAPTDGKIGSAMKKQSGDPSGKGRRVAVPVSERPRQSHPAH